MQSGMPTPRKPLPVTKSPGCARARARWPPCARDGRPRAARCRVPAIDAREQRVAADADQRRSAASDRATSSCVGLLERARIAGAADERPQQHAVRPARDAAISTTATIAARMPVVLDARHDKAGSVQRMRDRVAPERERNGRGRGVAESRRTGVQARRRRRAGARCVTYAGVASTIERASILTRAP